MTSLTVNYRKIKSKKSWNKVVLGSAVEEDIVEIVLNYYMDKWQDIVRDFKLQNYNDARAMLHYAMQRFLMESRKKGPYFVELPYRQYLEAIHTEIKTHYLEMWEVFEQDKAYQKALAESPRWLRALRRVSPKCPLTYRDLKVCLASCEAYMLVIE